MKRIIVFLCLVSCFTNSSAQQTENVFLITIDGLRWQEVFAGADSSFFADRDYVNDRADIEKRFWTNDSKVRREKLLPFFWNTLATQGQLYGNRWEGNESYCTNSFWFSYPGYNEILSGFSDPRIRSNDKIPNPNKTVLEYFNQLKGFKGKVAAFGSWDVFPYIINEERSGIPVNAGFEKAKGKKLTKKEKFLNEIQPQIPSPWATVRLDAFTHHYALEYIKKKKPRLIYISYGETDDFAHNGKYDAYLKSAYQTDAFIKELWDFVQSHRKYRNKTTFIITTDHGRGFETIAAWKSHGTIYKGSNEIWIAAIGPDTPALGERKQQEKTLQSQIAKTLAKLLGKEYGNPDFEVGEVINTVIR